MELRFALLDGRGWLTVRELQGRVECKGEMPDDKKGLYKGWLLGRGGRVPLGAFVPEQGRLRLSRALPLSQLEGQGVWPPTGAEAELVYSAAQRRQAPPSPPGWSWIPDPGRLMGEPLLAQAAGSTKALLHKEEQGFSLAYPFRVDGPFPLTPLFCFSRIVELEGRAYVVFPFRPGGCPRVE